MKILAIIPARSGSKRLRDKNMRGFEGKPLVLYAIQKAMNVADKVLVSLDSYVDEYTLENYTEGYKNVELVIRPKELATDDATSEYVVLHHIKDYPDYDAILFMQCTSPLTKTEDLQGMLELFKKNDLPAIATVNHHCKFTGACIIIKKEEFLKHGTFWVPGMAVYMIEEDADIDDLSDFVCSEAFFRGDVYGI